MKTLHLHIGTGRTGTSALQRWFAEQVAALAEQGIHYHEAPSVERARRGEVTSGNGTTLFAHIAPDRHSNPFLPDRLRQTVATYCGERNGLASSERLATLVTAEWHRLAEAADGMTVRIVCVVRDPVDSLWSAFGRHRGNGVTTASFPEYLQSPHGRYQSARALRAVLSVFPKDQISVFHYDENRHRLDRCICETLGIDLPPMPADLVNRSDHAGALGRGEIEFLAQREAANIDWLNDTFFNGRPTVRPISDRLAATL